MGGFHRTIPGTRSLHMLSPAPTNTVPGPHESWHRLPSLQFKFPNGKYWKTGVKCFSSKRSVVTDLCVTKHKKTSCFNVQPYGFTGTAACHWQHTKTHFFPAWLEQLTLRWSLLQRNTPSTYRWRTGRSSCAHRLRSGPVACFRTSRWPAGQRCQNVALNAVDIAGGARIAAVSTNHISVGQT